LFVLLGQADKTNKTRVNIKVCFIHGEKKHEKLA